MATEEEDNYIRIALLLFGISPRAVRHYFDEEFPPSRLERSIRQRTNSLKDLQSKGIINQSQWDLLFPRTGPPESKNFDVTLMITVLRNLAPVQVPDNLPTPTDTSKGAALGTIKYYRNYVAHLHDTGIHIAQFSIMWTAIEKAVSIVGGAPMHEETKHLKTKVLDRSNKEIMLSIQQSEKEIKELKQIVIDLTTEQESLKTQHLAFQQKHTALEKKYMDPVPAHIRDIIKSQLKAWKDEDTMFIVTSSAKAILKCCINNFCVTITGSSGVGKTATVRHVALRMAERGYDVIPINEPSHVREYYNSNKKSLFVVDDFCGRFSADKTEIDRWEQLTETSLRYLNNNVKFIVSCRLQVFQDEIFDSLSLFKTCVCNFATDFKISEDDIKYIVDIYSSENAEDIIQYAHLYDCFPLLCKLYSDNPSLGLGFFEHPFTVYKTELNQMYKTQNYVSYCALALCVMFNNNIQEELLTEEIDHDVRSVFKNTFEACKLNRGTSRIQIRDALKVLINIYIRKEGNVYKTIHDKLFDFLSFHFGTELVTCLIKNANIRWISKRIIIDKYKVKLEPEFTLIVNSQYSSMLMKRMVKEWSKGRINDVFFSLNMRESEFRKDFFCFIQSLDTSEQNDLAQKSDVFDKTNALIFSVMYVEKEWIKWCLYHGISVNMSDARGGSPLHTACHHCTEHTEIVQLLLNNNADPNKCTTDNGMSPLHVACLQSNLEIVQLLLDNKAHINQCTTDDGATPLHMACQNGHKEIVQKLLEHKADINRCTTNNGSSPLHVACYRGHANIIQTLIDNNADINKGTSDNSFTPLFLACQEGHTKIVQILLDNKAEINLGIKHRKTPLIMACQKGYTEIVQLLLENKADINQCTTDNGVTPLHAACWKGHTEIVQTLIDNKVNINQCSTDIGYTPLHMACQYGHTEIVKKLINNKADINQCTTDVCGTPLHAACIEGHTEIVTILLNHKANINQYTIYHDTALFIACSEGFTNIVKILIDNKADTNVCSKRNGRSPLCAACHNGHIEIVKIILDSSGTIKPCQCPNLI